MLSSVVWVLLAGWYISTQLVVSSRETPLWVNKVYVKTGENPATHEPKYQLVVEPALKEATAALKAVYTNIFLCRLRRLMPRQLTGALSWVYGKFQSTKDYVKTAKKINEFLSEFGFKWSDSLHTWVVADAEKARISLLFSIKPHEWVVPKKGFESFNDFFIKQLKPDVRPIFPDSDVMVSPADGKLTVVENLTTDSKSPNSFFNVKSEKFTLQRFLNSDDLAREYAGGTLLIFRLSPYNYHHFHFPINCVPIKKVDLSGGHESVDPITYKTNINPLVINARHLVKLQTSFGQILMVIVGAYNVGSIKEFFETGRQYKKGDEAGYFQYGGSTIALVFKRGTLDVGKQFLTHSRQGYETSVAVGERIGELKPQKGVSRDLHRAFARNCLGL